MPDKQLPVIGVSACLRELRGRPQHSVGAKYLEALADCGPASPLIVPALGNRLDVARTAGLLDGLLLTGSLSNVHPPRYGQEPSARAEPYDLARDETVFALLEEAIRQQLPVFAICRGFQELNVALGGTLHPEIHEVDARDDHRAPQDEDLDIRYGERHEVRLKPEGRFATILETDRVTVNSLHRQGVDRLAPPLVAEGEAADGTVEAVAHKEAGFVLGVQWHPEYKARQNPVSRKLFAAFAEAARERAARR
ncbi:MAG: gamma-glutamyl-gamma-aminobutyrate hydrolase family protein [Kiloniellales bacterium]